MVAVSERLRVRLEPLCPGFDYSQHGQLSVVLKRLEPIATRLGDISTSDDCHILLERAYAALGRSRESLY